MSKCLLEYAGMHGCDDRWVAWAGAVLHWLGAPWREGRVVEVGMAL